jgi:chromosome segregation ATPase
MRQTANLLEGISDEIAAIYATKTGKTQKEMRDLMKSETWMTAKQAVEMGFADSIFDTKAKNMASILDRFKPDAALTEKVIGLEASVASAENQVTEISAQLTEVQNDFATAIAELSELKASNESITAQLTEAQALLQAEKESVTAKATEIETLNAQLIESQNSASAKAAEILASAGVPPIDANQDPLETKTLREQINALPTAQARLEATLKNWDKLNK